MYRIFAQQVDPRGYIKKCRKEDGKYKIFFDIPLVGRHGLFAEKKCWMPKPGKKPKGWNDADWEEEVPVGWAAELWNGSTDQ